MPAVVSYAMMALQYVPSLVTLGVDVVGWVKNQTSIINQMVAQNREPTDAEWDALHATIKTLSDQLQAAK